MSIVTSESAVRLWPSLLTPPATPIAPISGTDLFSFLKKDSRSEVKYPPPVILPCLSVLFKSIKAMHCPDPSRLAKAAAPRRSGDIICRARIAEP